MFFLYVFFIFTDWEEIAAILRILGLIVTLLPKAGKPNNECENLIPTGHLNADAKDFS